MSSTYAKSAIVFGLLSAVGPFAIRHVSACVADNRGTAFSFAFTINALGFIGTSQFAAKLGGRFGTGRVVVAATFAYALFTTMLLGFNFAGVDSLAVMIVLLFLGFTSMGLVIPSTMVLALEEHGPIRGNRLSARRDPADGDWRRYDRHR